MTTLIQVIIPSNNSFLARKFNTAFPIAVRLIPEISTIFSLLGEIDLGFTYFFHLHVHTMHLLKILNDF